MDLDGIYRTEYGRCVATLTRLLGDIGLAEEAVQDAFAVALQKWDATPPNPGAWIVTTARNRAIDRLRRESTRQTRHTQALLLHQPGVPGLDARRPDTWRAGLNVHSNEDAGDARTGQGPIRGWAAEGGTPPARTPLGRV